MWPFTRRKRDAAQLPPPWVIDPAPEGPAQPGMIDEPTICPICLDRFGPGTIAIDYPFCPECCSEAITWDVEPFDTYLAGKSASDFTAMLKWWDSKRRSFLPAYYALKRARILALLAIKQGG